jgi:eukaryotic-like serine/threonine-protein kinase
MMLTDQIGANPDWASLPGRVLEGGYEVQELLEAEEGRAKYKIHVLGGGGMDAFANFIQANAAPAEDQVALWGIARQLEHANLNTPLAAGQTQLDGVELIYVVLRKPDEILSSAVCERPLSSEEAGQVLVNVCQALEHLHNNDLVHGYVSPEQIFALGDLIQLSTEGVRRIGSTPAFEVVKAKYLAPESAGVNITPAADVWCLGATLSEILEPKDSEIDLRERAGKLAKPYGTIVERCLDPDPQTRCKLPELLALHRAGDGSSVRGKQTPLPEPELARVRNATPMPVGEMGRTAQTRRTQTDAERPRVVRWMYAVLVLIAVLLIIWAVRPKHAKPTNAPLASVAKPADGRATTKSSWQTRTLAPETAFSSGKPQPSAPSASSASSQPRASVSKPQVRIVTPNVHTINGPIWRLIVFTYSTVESAQSRANLINQKHPELQAQVFSPDGHGGLYLVTLGGGMQRDDAVSLRQKALRLGMPRDSYIQNYKQ